MQVEICPEDYKLKNKYICPIKISNKVDQCIKNIADRNGFVKYHIEKKEFSTNGGNYLGLLYEVNVNGHTNEGKKELNIFVKSILTGDKDLEILSVQDIYQTEMFAYKVLLKVFDELQEEANVPPKERYKMVKSYEESDAEVIIMENVAKKGFRTGHRMDVPSLQFAEKAIAELAKFHSFAFVLKVKRPAFFEEQIKTRKAPYNAGEQWQGLAQSMIKIVMENIDDGVKERVEKIYENIGDRYTSYYEAESLGRCLCHGDYRPNNILTKTIDGEITELIPVDYQLMYYGCPIIDFLYFIMVCTDKPFRKAHLMHLKNVYHMTMTRFLKYFDLDINDFYSREDFEKDYEKTLGYGLVYSLIFLPFMFASEDDVPDLTRDDIANLSITVDESNMEEKGNTKMDESVDTLPQNLQNHMENIAKNEGFITYKITSKNLSTKGGSYMGILYEVNIKGKTKDEDKETNIFIKNIVTDEQMKIYSVTDVFAKEAFVYTELSKIFTELQKEANIPNEERFQMAKSYEECNSKSIILENLGKRGFKVYDRMETIPLDYAEMCVQQLGKLHGLSMVFQEKRPDYFNKHVATMKQPFIFEEDWYGFVENMYNYSVNCLDPDVKERVGQKIKEKVNNYPKYMNDTSGVCTFCHGDYKHNNIMVKEDDGKLKEVVTIDFQISHYGCPILDFLYLIFNGTDQEFRKKHLTDLKDLYYGTMEKFLSRFEMDISKIFPRMEFERVYKEKLDFGLMINVFYVPFLFAAADEAPDVAKETLSTLSFNVDSRFTQRFRGVVDDFIQWGYL
ncbi:hypothetical protein SFRURICE_012602 [Spodoptera frugiperda]|nr:hypothetical protein SFRURICE_012602 [Spodoptera frugiperda]